MHKLTFGLGRFDRRRAARAAALLPILLLAACASLGSSGPTTRSVRAVGAERVQSADVKIIPVEQAVARGIAAAPAFLQFSEVLGDAPPAETIIGRGDVLQISIWEAPPAVLFGATSSFGGAEGGEGALITTSVARQNSLPETMVDEDGMIQVPFAGSIRAAGLSPRQVERAIIGRLARKAHLPQVAVRIARNISSAASLVGEVATNTQVPLTPRGERLLDALATAGGVKTPVDKTVIQISREGAVVRMPMAAVIRDPRQNIRLRPNDIVTAISQAFSFTALGETGTTSEVPFEATGITLAQALARAGGLKSDRADVNGVFVFRLEDPAVLDPAMAATSRRTADGRIPVVYVLNMKNASALLNAQLFPMRDKDVLYIARAPLTDLQRIVSTVGSIAFPLLSLQQYVR